MLFLTSFLYLDERNTLLSPYNITCIYDFRPNNLALVNQLVCSSLVRTASSTPTFVQWLVEHCVGLTPPEFFHMKLGMLTGIIFVEFTF